MEFFCIINDLMMGGGGGGRQQQKCIAIGDSPDREREKDCSALWWGEGVAPYKDTTLVTPQL